MNTGTGLRACPPETSRQFVRPLLARFGIRRIVDLRPLDKLGVPVCASVRPRGRTLAVHAGKGLSPLCAWVGAAMEALELAVAELAATEDPGQRANLAEWAATLPKGLTPADLAPAFGCHALAQAPVQLTACEVLGQRSVVLLPVQDVHPRLPAEEPRLFPWTSNGLASGNDVAEATLHAVLEVLERDALAMNAAHDESAWLDPARLPDPIGRWAEDWRRLGIGLLVRQVPNDFGLPCFSAWIHEPHNPGITLAGGSGLHLSRDIALARAVTEAAQSRLTTLHGGRDDLPRSFEQYHASSMQERLVSEADLLRRFSSRERSTEWLAVPSWEFQSPRQALSWLRRRLADRGFPWVIRRRLDSISPRTQVPGFAVVKVIVPRCESIEQNTGRMGPRLMARVLEHA